MINDMIATILYSKMLLKPLGHMKPLKKYRTGRSLRVIGGALRDERGDVLMEYVLLTLLIILPLVGVSVGLVNVSGKTFSSNNAVAGEDFGLLGNAFVDRYRMVMSGISLPLP